MSTNKQMSFGRRTEFPDNRGTVRLVRSRWPIWVVAGIVVCGMGAVALGMLARQAASQARRDAAVFLTFAEQQPQTAKHYVLSSIEPCLADGARAYWSDATVKTFAGEVLFKALSLHYADLTPDQRDGQFREWIGPAASHLTLDEQTQFRGLMNNGLHQAGTRECLVAEVQELMRG